MRLYLFIFLLFIVSKKTFSQAIPRFNPDTILTMKMDKDAVVKVGKAGLDIEDFIHEIVTDSSFYEAFKNMAKYTYNAQNSIYTFDKKNKVTGSISRKLIHNPKGNHLKIVEETTTGDLFKRNGNYQLITLELFDHIFMNAYKSAYSPASEEINDGSKNDSYKDKLKTLIFSPGKPVKGVPLISSKTEIFTANNRQYYNYAFAKGMYLDSIPVYRFKVTVKPDLGSWTADGIMIKELTTIFDQRNFQILGRYMDMKLDNLAFSFDVQMNIEMSYFGEDLLPTKVSYQGNWDVPFKKQERASFLVLHKGYNLN
ncbi:hypothetical protein [Pedobacter alpinus]|uniref:Uncharacterized protein n=1 Tax=Pedobacter alpinus TaxID=1590643 RepID=A0ABW5TV41_9SPHI